MYSPAAFQVHDRAVIREFIRQHSFGILLSHDGATLHDTHTPLLVSDDLAQLRGHLARANPHWRGWSDGAPVKVIFHGPHAYVSPRYYRSEFNVPTWNYSAVSVDGRLTITQDPAASRAILAELVAHYEGPAGWQLDASDPRFDRLAEAIVSFTIAVDAIEAKFKLNQNKSADDRASVFAHLAASADLLDQQTAALMRLHTDAAQPAATS